ncbi:phospho-N-acetylmuramoyl-pentapeptide-transferase [bacterium]|nr:phospho-N-acetylmuramoyl-pentapeptide-transferase [bacterium]
MIDLIFGPFLNLLHYVNFRAPMAAVTAGLFGILLGPLFIHTLVRLRMGQPIRGAGIPSLYEKHKGKQGTPTMGGLLILASLLFSLLLWGDLGNRHVWLAILVTTALGAVGAVDDFAKLRGRSHRGLSARQKLAWQGGIGLFTGLWIYFFLGTEHNAELALPFFKHAVIPLGVLYILFAIIVIVGSSNAVNLTDGLDGLAIGCVIATLVPFTILAYLVGRPDFTRYLLIWHVPGAQELAVFGMALLGAGMAFLWYNAHPAQVFMGDTGSLALGGALGVMALCLKQEVLLVLIGGIFVIEALSVILQVASYKLRGGRRIFRMTPLHHHFEQLGWPEARIVIRFWIVATILGMLGLATLKVR